MTDLRTCIRPEREVECDLAAGYTSGLTMVDCLDLYQIITMGEMLPLKLRKSKCEHKDKKSFGS